MVSMIIYNTDNGKGFYVFKKTHISDKDYFNSERLEAM